jgi:phage/plasmid-associated DNA primase
MNFSRTFNESTTDPTLPEKLTAEEELSGILNWTLEGLKRLMENGFRFLLQKDCGRNAGNIHEGVQSCKSVPRRRERRRP